jgi:DNA replication protein DnaC
MSTPPDTKPDNKHTKRKMRIALIVVGSVIATAILGLLTGFIPKDFQEKIKLYFDAHPMAWTIAVVLSIAILVVATYWLTDKGDNTKKSNEPEPAELTDDERHRFIKLLQNRYARRLQQKTGERFALKLELRYTLNGVQQLERLDMAARQPGQPNAELAELIQKHRNLLLMGQPGAGKTTLLLGTASTLLQEAANNKTKPLPVIFNLASWKNTEPSFAEWMANILVQGYSYPPKRAKKDVQDGNLLLLLDGLDEVGSDIIDEAQRNEQRKLCLAAIQAYQAQRKSPAGMIICTRTNEYLAAGGDAPVHAQLLIQPIDKTELQDCLQKISQGEGQAALENANYRTGTRFAATNLLQLTANSSNLTELLCTPFYFNAALQVLHKPGDGSISFVYDREHTRQKLEALYINRTLSKNKAYRPEKIRRWLSWLAHWQHQRSSVSFELISFGAGSLRLTPKQVKQYDLFVGLLGIVFVGLVGGLVVGLVGGLVGGLFMILVVSLFAFLVVSLFLDERDTKISTHDITHFSIKAMAYRKFLNTMVFTLFMGLLVSLQEGFLEGLFVALVLGLIVGLLEGFPTAYFIEITRPTQRLYAGLRFTGLFFAIGLVVFYPFSLGVEVPFLGSQIPTVIIIVPSFFFIQRSLPLLQFISVQLTLSRLGHLPVRMARFFDYCANELHLLEKDTGGSWRFRHQIIQDHFLQKYRSRQ